MARKRPADLRANLRGLGRTHQPNSLNHLAVHVAYSDPAVLPGVHVVVEVDGVPLLNPFHDGLSQLVGVHPEAFFAPGGTLWPRIGRRATLRIGIPTDCVPECCGVGTWVWKQGQRVHWHLIGDRWNRWVPSLNLEFDLEEYLFTLQWARDRWSP